MQTNIKDQDNWSYARILNNILLTIVSLYILISSLWRMLTTNGDPPRNQRLLYEQTCEYERFGTFFSPGLALELIHLHHLGHLIDT